MKISVIVPFYNTEKYIKDCLESLYRQSFSDFEVLMINDESTDDSISIAKEYASKDNRFKLINTKHIGFPNAKNLGLDLAQGDYICFVDSDDYVDDRYLELLYNTVVETNSDISCCGYNIFGNKIPIIDNRQYTYYIFKDEEKMNCLLSPTASTFMWNKIYKRELFDNLRHDDVMALSDTLIMYKLFDRAKRISKTNLKLISHRMHKENMTNKSKIENEGYWEHRLQVYLKMCSFIYHNYENYKQQAQYRFTLEFLFKINRHLSEEQVNTYLEKDEVKELLDANLYEIYKRNS